MQQEETAVVLDNEKSFEELLNESMVSIYSGDVVRGTVIDVTPAEIIVDLGFKSDGIIARDELSMDSAREPWEFAKVGDEIEAFVMRVRDGDEGKVELSLRKLEVNKAAKKIRSAAGTGESFIGKVTRVIDGGLIVHSADTKIFVPMSQVPQNLKEDTGLLLNKEFPVSILEVDEKRRKVVGSMRQAKPVNTKEMEVFWNGIIIGKELTGKVKNFTSFGAFIDLGGVDGLVHNTELSWEKNMAPEDIFEIGQEVSVWVKDFDPEARRVSLGYRKAEDNPWNKYAGQVSEGDILNVKIVRISPFGAFAEIFPGIDGLIHISELDVGRVDNVSSKVKVGQEVEVKVIKIDDEKGKISLSIAALLDGYIIKDAEKELNADDTAPHLQ